MPLILTRISRESHCPELSTWSSSNSVSVLLIIMLIIAQLLSQLCYGTWPSALGDLVQIS